MISLVIVTYQSAAVIVECLQHAQAVPNSEIIIVDNASTDDTRAHAEFGGVTPVIMPHNTGFATAANAGARAARGELLCFLNPDCVIDSAVCAAASQTTSVRVNTCAVPDFQMNGRLVEGRQPGYTRTKLLADMTETSGWPRFLSDTLRKLPTLHDTNWHWPLGTCLFVPRATFLALGGFDERYFLYMEDVEFGRALAASGGELITLPHALAHRGGESTNVSTSERVRQLELARIAYGRRHYGRLFAKMLRLIGRHARR